MSFITKSAEETSNLGQKVGQLLAGGEVILLTGDLGGGKTQFTKGLAEALGVTEMIVSPTFTIERIYAGKELVLHHFDFYRLNGSDQELSDELNELIQDPKNVLVIEWPENIDYHYPIERLEISFEYIGDVKRKLKLDAYGEKHRKFEAIK